MSADPFIVQLSDLCGAHRVRPKWVVVPSHAVGLTLGDRLAREGCDWVNLRFVTPLDLAARMAAPFLLEEGIDPSEETLGPALVMRLLLETPEEGGYFRPMAQHPSMAHALWRTLRELRYCGMRAHELAATPFAAAKEKQSELAALLSAFERHLDSSRVADMPLVFEEAVRHPDWCPIRGEDLVLERPGVPWAPVVRRFLDVLPGHRVPAQAKNEPGGGVLPPRLAAPGVSLDIFHAGGRDAELDEVFRRILSSQTPLDQVEVVCSSSVPASLVWEKAKRLGWDVTVSAGLPVTTTRPGRLLLRFCDWIDSDFEAATLRVLLQSGDLAAKAIAEDVSAGQAARMLLKTMATWGRDTYAGSLTRAAKGYDEAAEAPEETETSRAWNRRKADQARALDAWVGDILPRIPAPDGSGAVSVTALVDAAAWFTATYAGRAGSLDAIARDAVIDALNGLRALGDYRCEMRAGVRLLRQSVESLLVGRARSRPGQLHVSTLRDAGDAGRPVVFVVGLEEGALFSSAVEDAVLLDVERKALGHGLRTSADRQDEELSMVAARFAALGSSCTTLCLSFSCRDTREFRETFPSWIVLQAFRLQQGNDALRYEDLADHLGEPASSVPRTAGQTATDVGWWLAHREAPGAAEEILRAFPSLARGRQAERQRASSSFTPYDGFVPEAGASLDPSRTRRPVSATSLEDAAKCPLRFFMRNALGVRPIEEAKADEDAWLDALTRGTELHALFARIMRAVRDEQRKPRLDEDQPRLRKWASARLLELRAEVPPPSEEVFERESREFLDDLDAFITAECEGRHGPNAIGFEVSFGFPLAPGNTEWLARPAPIEIDIGGGRRFVLHGYIDRVNKLRPGEYEVADYKSSYWPDDWKGEFAGGTRLQHAIYGFAAAQALRRTDPGVRVVQGTYLFPTMRGHRQRKTIAAPSKKKLADVLRALADVIGAGVFAASDKEGACRWCEFKAACHAERNAEADAQPPEKSDAALAPFVALRANHE
jgi:ATP-dependent helicase/nuclease subunit B